MADPSFRLLVLDELNIALRYDYLPLGEVVDALRARRPGLHVVVTGRNARPELLDRLRHRIRPHIQISVVDKPAVPADQRPHGSAVRISGSLVSIPNELVSLPSWAVSPRSRR